MRRLEEHVASKEVMTMLQMSSRGSDLVFPSTLHTKDPSRQVSRALGEPTSTMWKDTFRGAAGA